VDAEDIEPIETDKGAVPFSFTSFASSEANIQNLSPVSEDVIVEGKEPFKKDWPHTGLLPRSPFWNTAV
ncbi:MAG: hypothetical protein ACFNYD_02550, partial [Bacteroides sp.]